MYDLQELSTQQKVELELMLKKGCNATEARKESKYLLKDSKDKKLQAGEMFEGSGFVNLPIAETYNGEDEFISVRVKSINNLEPWMEGCRFTSDGKVVYVKNNVEDIISFLEEYQNNYGDC